MRYRQAREQEMTNTKQAQRTPLAQAYERSKAGREALFAADCRPMECTEDKCGIVWERFITPDGRSLVIIATPHWWDVYAPVHDGNDLAATIAAIKSAAIAKAEA